VKEKQGRMKGKGRVANMRKISCPQKWCPKKLPF